MITRSLKTLTGKRCLLAAVLLTIPVWTGCDSDDPEEEVDAERLLGTWTAASITTSSGVELRALVETFQARFPTSATFRLSAANNAGTVLLDASGTFVVDEARGELTLTSEDFTGSIRMQYQFESGTVLVLTFPGTALARTGIGLAPSILQSIAGEEVTATMQRQ